jgi:hypothetical protein
MQVEHLDEKEYKKFQRELVADPTKGPVSHGTKDLMRLFGGAAPPPPRQPAQKTPVTEGRVAPARRGP